MVSLCKHIVYSVFIFKGLGDVYPVFMGGSRVYPGSHSLWKSLMGGLGVLSLEWLFIVEVF